jgi:putative nucleotidyltransferase with HDIG domain
MGAATQQHRRCTAKSGGTRYTRRRYDFQDIPVTVSAAPSIASSPAASFDPRSLPALSPLVSDLLGLDIDDDDAEKTLIRVVESEPQLSIRLIAMANSAAYAHSGQSFDAIGAAVRRIGLARTRQLAIGMLFGNPLQSALPSALAEGLWIHGLTVAAAAQEIARRKKAGNPGAAYLAGLVHDLGYMAEELCAPGALQRNAELSARDHVSLEQAEHRAHGVDHAELTCRILQHWNAPAEIIEAIRWHHELDIAPDSLAATLYGAEKLARFIELTEILYAEGGHPFPGMSFDRDGLDYLFSQQLELSSEEVAILAERIIGQVDSFRQCARALHGRH